MTWYNPPCCSLLPLGSGEVHLYPLQFLLMPRPAFYFLLSSLLTLQTSCDFFFFSCTKTIAFGSKTPVQSCFWDRLKFLHIIFKDYYCKSDNQKPNFWEKKFEKKPTWRFSLDVFIRQVLFDRQKHRHDKPYALPLRFFSLKHLASAQTPLSSPLHARLVQSSSEWRAEGQEKALNRSWLLQL